jgi:hypothetical protein
MVISDSRMTAIFTHFIMVISCHQYTKVGDLQAMTTKTLLDDSQNWGHFWKIKSIHGTYQYPTYAILNLCCTDHCMAAPRTKKATKLLFLPKDVV